MTGDGPVRGIARADIVMVAGLCLLFSAVAAWLGYQAKPGGDFHVFWQAGRDFAAGRPLYGNAPGARDFIYPPFAAMIFQLLAPFPLRVAAGVFTMLNCVLLALAARLSLHLVKLTMSTRSPRRLPLLLAFTFSAQFMLNNLRLIQVNQVVFVLVLLGILFTLRGRTWWGAAFVVSAASLKLTPAVFVVWLVMRERRRAAVAAAACLLVAIALPLVWRGLAQGMRDLVEYRRAFLQGFLDGRVITNYTNQSLAALIFRLLAPAAEPGATDFRLLSVSIATARAIYFLCAGGLTAALVGGLAVLRRRRAPVSAFELGAVFLFGHLLSAITWKAHMVTLLFVGLTFFAVRQEGLERGERMLLRTAWGLIFVTGLAGRELLGRAAHLYAGGYSLFAWSMILLFVISLVFSLRDVARRGNAA